MEKVPRHPGGPAILLPTPTGRAAGGGAAQQPDGDGSALERHVRPRACARGGPAARISRPLNQHSTSDRKEIGFADGRSGTCFVHITEHQENVKFT